MLYFLLKLYIVYRLETQVDASTFTWNTAGLTAGDVAGTGYPVTLQFINVQVTSPLFFSWNRIRHVATPEFSVVRHLILLQGGTTTGQRPSLTPAGKMCSPLTCRREKVNELATLCVCLVSPFPPSIVATPLLSTPPMGLGHHDQDLEPPSGSGQVRKGEYLS